MKTHGNEVCKSCSNGTNSINGRYCNNLHKYVEYTESPICKQQ